MDNPLAHSAPHHHTASPVDYSTTSQSDSGILNDSTTAFSNLIQAAAMAAAAVAAATAAKQNNINTTSCNNNSYGYSPSTSSPTSSSSYHQSPPQHSSFRHWSFAAPSSPATTDHRTDENGEFSNEEASLDHSHNPLNEYNLDKYFAEQILRRSSSIPCEIYRDNNNNNSKGLFNKPDVTDENSNKCDGFYASKHAKILAYHSAKNSTHQQNNTTKSSISNTKDNSLHDLGAYYQHSSSQQSLHHYHQQQNYSHNSHNNHYPLPRHFPSLSSLPLSSKSLSESLNAPPFLVNQNNNSEQLSASLSHYFYSSTGHLPPPPPPHLMNNKKPSVDRQSSASNKPVTIPTVPVNSSTGTKRPKSTFPFGRCRVCNDKATGVHYGIATCEGCKGFFKRSTLKKEKYRCFFGNNCPLTPDNRNRCKACRFKKCLEVGMSIQGVKMGRIPKAEKERALMMLQSKETSDDLIDLPPGSNSNLDESENATEEEYGDGEESESSVNLSESEYDGTITNSPITPTKIELTKKMNKIALSQVSKSSSEDGSSSGGGSPVSNSDKQDEESVDRPASADVPPVETSSTAVVSVKRKSAPARTVQDEWEFVADSHRTERSSRQDQQHQLSESQYTKLFSEYFFFKFNNSVANRINQHTLQITATSSLQNNIDEGICLMYPVLIERVEHAFSRLTAKVTKDYQLKLKRQQDGITKPPGHDLTLKDVWAGLLQGIPSSVKNNISYCKLLPGVAQLQPKTFTSLINLNMLNIYLLERSKLFEGGENNTILANGIQYTRHWMSQVIGNQMTDAIFNFESDYIEMNLTEREQAVLVPYGITKFNHHIDGGDKLKVLNEFYRKLLTYVFDSNRRDAHFIDKVEQLIDRFPHLNDLSAQAIGSLTPNN